MLDALKEIYNLNMPMIWTSQNNSTCRLLLFRVLPYAKNITIFPDSRQISLTTENQSPVMLTFFVSFSIRAPSPTNWSCRSDLEIFFAWGDVILPSPTLSCIFLHGRCPIRSCWEQKLAMLSTNNLPYLVKNTFLYKFAR